MGDKATVHETDDSGSGDDVSNNAEGGARNSASQRDDISLGGIDRSIRPGVPVPYTVLVFALNHGGYFLVGHPSGEPAAWVIAKDAHLLDRALRDAFGSDQPGNSRS